MFFTTDHTAGYEVGSATVKSKKERIADLEEEVANLRAEIALLRLSQMPSFPFVPPPMYGPLPTPNSPFFNMARGRTQ